MNDKWNLNILYNGFDDEKFAADTKLLDDHIASLETLAAKAKELDALTLIREFLRINNDLSHNE